MTYQLHLAKEYNVITFPSTQHALRAEKFLQNNSLDFIIIPTPREITSSCGLSIKFFVRDTGLILNLLDNNQILHESVYQINKQTPGNLISKINRPEN